MVGRDATSSTQSSFELIEEVQPFIVAEILPDLVESDLWPGEPSPWEPCRSVLAHYCFEVARVTRWVSLSVTETSAHQRAAGFSGVISTR